MTSAKPVEKSWKEHNQEHKEKRKKWREEKLIKKVKRENAEKQLEEIQKNSNGSIQGIEKVRVSTLSIAVPGSILDNAQSPELRTYLAGQIARAACMYKVDEIVVFDDKGEVTEYEKKKMRNDVTLGEARIGCVQLAKILQYLECPQYLRKYLFPLQKDLQYAGVLNPLDAPHHLRQQDVSLFREGVITNKPIKVGKGSQVNVGLYNDVHVDKVLLPGLRVTVKIPPEQENLKKLKGIVVSPSMPRSETGIYWGYTVRLASNVSEVFSACPFTKYDLSIGTSDKGTSIDDVSPYRLKYNHALVVFGGLSGLEAAIELDSNLDVNDTASLFTEYLNTCPEQGSRTIRTEEAILISLAELRTKLAPKHPPLKKQQFPVSSVDPTNSNMTKNQD